MTKELKYPICCGDSAIIVKSFGDRPNNKELSIWLCQGTCDDNGEYNTQYHVTTFDGELDELIKKLLQIRANKDKFSEFLNKSR
jgi:hypothetical protein